ncbi:MAG: ABC transporter permease [Chloroflexi bacterium]|nr:MAG: ABC transporter permease [Chloroflexota bacterium]
MITYILRRVLILIPLIFLISVVTFTIIQLPAGDYLSTYIAQLESQGTHMAEEQIQGLRIQYGLDKPITYQYFLWIRKILFEGNFGSSFSYSQPVLDVISERIVLTMVITLTTSVFIWCVSLPIGIITALKQYSFVDYFWTFLGFVGMATPNFLLALVFAWLAFSIFGQNIIGLFSVEYADAPWNMAKVTDLLKHLWVPVILIGTSGTAGFIRVVRGTLLDELNKQYVITARAKGMTESKLLFKYPVRIVLNPMISTIGWMLPGLVSGEVLVSMVLNIPTTGPVLLNALLAQDMYLAGGVLLILSVLTLIGTLVSDIALVWLDPRIRYERAVA